MAEENNTTDTQNSTQTPGADAPNANPTPEAPSSTTGDQPKDDDGSILGDAGKDEPKPGEEAPKDEPKEDEPEPEPNALLGAPEGDYEITGLPEGTELDKDALAAFAPLAKEIGLSNEGASKVAAFYAENLLPKVAAQVQAQLNDQIGEIKRGWDAASRKAIAENPKFDGKTFKEVTGIAATAMDRLGGEGLREALVESGFANHPAMVEFAYRAGKAIKEDSFDRGDGPGAAPATLQSALYGNKET